MIPKFKAWHKKLKTMFEVLAIDLFNKAVTVKFDKECYKIFSFDDIILMQSTGLKDKNGTEIFEGDVVKVDGRKTEVVKFGKIIHEEDFGGFAIYQGYSLMLGGGYPEAVMNEIEVIGNIYELESVEVE